MNSSEPTQRITGQIKETTKPWADPLHHFGPMAD